MLKDYNLIYYFILLKMEAVDIIDHPNYKIFKSGIVFSKIGNGRFLKNMTNKRGYHFVGLYINKKQKVFLIHRLLMQHFKPDEYDENLLVVHINRIRTDNRLKNLKMITQKQNIQNLGNNTKILVGINIIKSENN